MKHDDRRLKLLREERRIAATFYAVAFGLVLLATGIACAVYCLITQ